MATRDRPPDALTIWRTQKVVDIIIDEFAFNDHIITDFDVLVPALYDLLRLALVGRSWVKRSRYHFFREGYKKFDLDSARKIRVLSELLSNRYCTLKELTLRDVTLHNIIGRHGDGAIFPFLQGSNIINSFSITLSHPPMPLGAIRRNFPWNMISSWPLLQELRIVGRIPSIQTLGTAILSLPSLKELATDISFENSQIPPVVPGVSLPAIENLEVGPRGYQLFRWLSLYSPVSLKVLSLGVDSEDPSPLVEYAFRNIKESCHVFITLHQDTYAPDLAQGMMFLDQALELRVQLLYPDYTAIPIILNTLEALAPGIASPDLMDLTITLPTLQNGPKDQLAVLRALEEFLTESVPLLPEDLCICVCERSLERGEFF